MKIAFTGSTSTGKTTLANELMKNDILKQRLNKIMNADARSIIRSLGCKSMDLMNRDQNREFQILYFEKKKKMENSIDSFLAERSFVDIAAYWIIRDTYDQDVKEQNKIMVPCKEESKKYDLHIYLPFELIPFEADGYRSNDMDFHRRIDNQIRNNLINWNLKFIEIKTDNLSERIDIVTKEILRIT